jgi:hypothetical protein
MRFEVFTAVKIWIVAWAFFRRGMGNSFILLVLKPTS